MTAEQLEILKAHLTKTGAGTPCPCGSTEASVEGPLAFAGPPTLVEAMIGAPGTVVLPCVSIVCKRCFRISLFAWLPIVEKAAAEEQR